MNLKGSVKQHQTVETVTIEANGMSFTADLGGDPQGELVVMLHGFPQTRYTWRSELALLADNGYKVCAYDQRGYSPGARPQRIEAYAVNHLVEDALGVVDALGHERFHLVGHDWGGGVAWMTALLNEERVSSLAIISRPHPAAFRRALDENAEQRRRSGHHQRNRERGATARILANDAQRLREGLARSGVPKADGDAYLETLNDYATFDAALNWYRALDLSEEFFAKVENFHRPTLYVWGNQDVSVGRYAAELTAQYVDAPYKFVELEGVGHFVTDQVPGAFPPLLLEHIRRINHNVVHG